MITDPTHLAKKRLRAQLLAARTDRMTADTEGSERMRWGNSWREHVMGFVEEAVAPTSSVCAFLPTGSEPPLDPTLESLHASGRRVFVPVSRPGRILEWARWTPDADVGTSRFGIREPVGTRHGPEIFRDAALRLVPALAVDTRGIRLGYGGGFYDTALDSAALGPHSGATVGICFADELLPAGSVPAEPHDAALPLVCTERGFTRIRQSP